MTFTFADDIKSITSVTSGTGGAARFNHTSSTAIPVGYPVTTTGFAEGAYNISETVTASADTYFELDTVNYIADDTGNASYNRKITQANEADQAILSVSENVDGYPVFNVPGHGYSTGDFVQITGTTSYNGGWKITAAGTNDFVVIGQYYYDRDTDEYTHLDYVADETGTVARGDSDILGLNGLTGVTYELWGSLRPKRAFKLDNISLHVGGALYYDPRDYLPIIFGPTGTNGTETYNDVYVAAGVLQIGDIEDVSQPFGAPRVTGLICMRQGSQYQDYPGVGEPVRSNVRIDAYGTLRLYGATMELSSNFFNNDPWTISGRNSHGFFAKDAALHFHQNRQNAVSSFGHNYIDGLTIYNSLGPRTGSGEMRAKRLVVNEGWQQPFQSGPTGTVEIIDWVNVAGRGGAFDMFYYKDTDGTFIFKNSDIAEDLAVSIKIGGAPVVKATQTLDAAITNADGSDNATDATLYIQDNIGTEYSADGTSAIQIDDILVAQWTEQVPDTVTYSTPAYYGAATGSRFDWMIVAYGKQVGSGRVPLRGNGGSSFATALLDDLGITQADKATVAAYTGFAFDPSEKILTISEAHTVVECYDWIKWYESENPAAVWDNGKASFVEFVQTGVFNFKDVRIVIASGGTLSVDTDAAVGALVFGDRPIGTRAIHVQVGGILNIGAASTTGRVLDFAQEFTSYQQAWDKTYCSLHNEGTLTWVGGEIQTHMSVSFDGASETVGGNAALVNDGYQQVDFFGLQDPQLRFEGTNTTVNALETNGLGLVFQDNQPSLSNITVLRANYALSQGNPFPDAEFLVLAGLDLSDPNIDADVGYWDENWARLVDSAAGSDIAPTGPLDNHVKNLGLVEIRQGIAFALNSGSGAKVYTRDTDNGNRLAADQISTNPDYVADRAYELTESGGAASYTTDGGVLTALHYRDDNTGLATENNEVDYRSAGNNTSDRFSWLKVEYGQQVATQDIDMRASGVLAAQIQSLPDIGITQADRAIVAAYTGISPVYAGGTLTVTITENHTWNEVYDYIKWYESENPDKVWDNGKQSFISTSNKLDYTYNNLVVVVNGANLTTGSDQILPTKPTIQSGGFFEDDEGAIWEDVTLKKASHFYGKVVNADSNNPIESTAIGYGDKATVTQLLYDTSLTLTGLATDVNGLVEGYVVYEDDGSSFAEKTMFYGEYNHDFAIIPRNISGMPIGTSTTPEVVRLQTDSEVTLPKADALLVNGITLNHATKTINLNTNTLSDSYDNLKARQASIDDIETGIPGCMSYCLYGQQVTKTGNSYMGLDDWTYQNIGSGGTWSGGTVEVDNSTNFNNYNFGAVTFDFTQAGSYDLRGTTFTAPITVYTTLGRTVTLKLPLGVSYTNNNPSEITIEQSTAVAITAPNLLNGSRVQLYNVTQDTEIENTVLTSAGYTYNGTLGPGFEFEDGDTIRLRVTYINGVTAKEGIETFGVITSGGLVFINTQEDDSIYNQIGIDGSTITNFTADYTDSEVDVVVASNYYVHELYAWWVYNLTLSDGIRFFYGGFIAEDIANFKVVTSRLNAFLDNQTTTNIHQLDDVRLYRDDFIRPVKDPSTGGGDVDVEWRSRVYTPDSTSGGGSCDSDEIADAVNDKLSEKHGIGSWEGRIGGGGFQISPESIKDLLEDMKNDIISEDKYSEKLEKIKEMIHEETNKKLPKQKKVDLSKIESKIDTVLRKIQDQDDKELLVDVVNEKMIREIEDEILKSEILNKEMLQGIKDDRLLKEFLK